MVPEMNSKENVLNFGRANITNEIILNYGKFQKFGGHYNEVKVTLNIICAGKIGIVVLADKSPQALESCNNKER